MFGATLNLTIYNNFGGELAPTPALVVLPTQGLGFGAVALPIDDIDDIVAVLGQKQLDDDHKKEY
eukprot:1751803-Amphidinium_carterae.1